MNFLLLLIAILSFCWALWLLRINRWPRVQVRVLRTWEEVTGQEAHWSTGYLHAELEYSYRGQRYQVLWRTDLSLQRHLPRACSMVVDPLHPDQPLWPANWKLPSVLIAVALLLSLNVFSQLGR
ncbi:hypothetical protein [Undibacterium sp.]|uniref:hypothetical protein n=1 Tax=Undibacterium sp. TaxID=1914977 RepID=UPI0025D9A189|nr:hypothetical protein [Undibacterium sp.]